MASLSPINAAHHYGRIKLRDRSTLNGSTETLEYAFLKNELPSHRINFRHPAYPPGSDLLFTLSAFDHAQGGIHHGFALSACAIIADNRDDGFLSVSREGLGQAVDVGIDDVLKAGQDYYYFVPPPGE